MLARGACAEAMAVRGSVCADGRREFWVGMGPSKGGWGTVRCAQLSHLRVLGFAWRQ